MVDSIYTKYRNIQYRGPSTSDDYNARIEEAYKDLTVLVNRARLSEETAKEYYRRCIKDQVDIERVIADLEERVLALEAADKLINLFDDSIIEYDRFTSTPFAISVADRLNADTRYGIATLPKVEASSLSKLSFTDTDGNVRLPSTLEAAVQGESGSADYTGAVVDTSLPEYAIRGGTGRIWERNIIANSPTPSYAQLTLYVKAPTDLFTTDKSNVLTLNTFPLLGADILNVSTTSKAAPVLDSSDGYIPINSNAKYSGESAAIGWTPPGGWIGDAILRAGPKKFYFDPRVVTAFAITLRQRCYFYEGNKYIYSYGASKIDLGYDKFLDSGKAIFRYDAPTGQTISTITNVLPEIYNVSEAELPNIFSYRTIWETSYGSGSYTTTPVALSNRVWIEVTLEKTTGNGTPALSGLVVSYT